MNISLPRRPWLLAGLLMVLVFNAGQLSVAHAAVITVNSTADNLTAGNGFCTLREAIMNANSDTDTTGGDCVAGSGPDTISVPAGTYTLSLGSALMINQNLTISGASVGSTRNNC